MIILSFFPLKYQEDPSAVLYPNTDEVLRYLGAGANAPEHLRQQVDALAQELTGRIQPRYTYRLFPLIRERDLFYLPQTGITLAGRTAKTMLDSCDQAVLLCCTLGAEFDALLRARQARDMAQAVILDACGSALVEAGCDAAAAELAAQFPDRHLTDRFSPGYGDLPLTLQPLICTALDTHRRLGVHATASMLLNPGKSVTAIIGLSNQSQMARVRGCAYCALNETCTLRKGGKHCAL